ncbi:MAG TPA: hypothetical protein VHN77_03740 [Phycisphaerales bacterium]|nr:hypothetical protein [Phycisphaerales bacterium]
MHHAHINDDRRGGRGLSGSLSAAWPHLRRGLVVSVVLGMVCTVGCSLGAGVLLAVSGVRGRIPTSKYRCMSSTARVDITVFDRVGLRVIDGHASSQTPETSTGTVDPLTGEAITMPNSTPPLLAAPVGANAGWYVPDCTTDLRPWKNVFEARSAAVGGTFTCYAAGFPLRCMQAVEFPDDTPAPASVGLVRLDARSERVVCLQPRWRELWLNVLAWTAAWMLVVGVAPAVRAVSRHRAGRCPRCGYDLLGASAPGCPECGWNRDRNGSTPAA